MRCSPYGVKPYHKQLLNMAFKKRRNGWTTIPECHKIKNDEEEM